MTVTSALAATGPVVTTSSSASGGSGDSAEIAGNFQQFLTLLTTQLKNQSPLDPLDTNQFTQQLVQFAQVEQQLKSNTTLSTIANGTKASTASSAAGLIGSTVSADGSSAGYANGAATWTLNSARAAASATLTITDSTGTVIATRTTPLAQGQQTFAWDGRTVTGRTVSTGTYKLSVAARDATGQPVSVSTDALGQVTSVDVSGDIPILTVGGVQVPLSSVKSIGN